MSTGDFPLRAPDLEIEEAGDGFIVYDEAKDRVHYLNHTAALVIELATGELEMQGIASWIARAYALEAPPIDDVKQLIDELREENLLLPASGIAKVTTPDEVTPERETVGAHN